MSNKKTPKVDPGSPFAKLQKLKDELAAKDAKPAAKAPTAKAAPQGPAVSDPRRGGRATASLPESAESAYEFHRLVAGVTPLGDVGKQRVPRAKGTDAAGNERAALLATAEAAAQAEDDAVHAHLRSLVDGGAGRFEVLDDGRRVEGRRVDVPPTQLRLLRRGQLPVDGRTDLHGLRAGEAHEALVTFLREQRVRGERCVLVVHGKGAHSPGGTGVLRGEIAAWLSQGPGSDHVAAFATAVDDDGGEGAVYVLLRR